MAFSQLTAALSSAKFEVAPALANVNFDFTLCKVQAPKEYQGVGEALSSLRREEAEIGTPHVTARKLGALFDGLLPSTPELIKAYGRRASEISESTSIDSQGRSQYGVFASRAGVDATSLWAAATSGGCAIAVHLLACMLARIWDGPEATSIWLEVVKSRRQEIITPFEHGIECHINLLHAARQELSRHQIREWDASARAWLRVADSAKHIQQKQLMLIIDNLGKPVNKKTDTYSSVMEAWKNSLIQMEGLVKGIAQKAHRGEILLALSSWHLYPDIMVVEPSKAEVRQNDSLIAAGGVLTIGIEPSEQQGNGVYWSLPLSYLRSYGRPVVSRSSIDMSERSRISLDELMQAVLGSFLSRWGDAGRDTTAAIHWLSSLLDMLRSQSDDGSSEARLLLGSKSQPSWFDLILAAAKAYNTSTGSERVTASKLLLLGQKHGSAFMGRPSRPLFDLTFRGRFLTLLRTEDDQISALRKVAKSLTMDLGLKPHTSFIRYYHESSGTYEYTTALPFVDGLKRGIDQQEPRGRHHRWLYAGGPLPTHVHLQSYTDRLRKNEGNIPSYRRRQFTYEQSAALLNEYEARKLVYFSQDETISKREDEWIEDLAPHVSISWVQKDRIPLEPEPMRRISCTDTDFKFIYGDVGSAALFHVSGVESMTDLLHGLGPDSALLYSYTRDKKIDSTRLISSLLRYFQVANTEGDPFYKSLKAISSAAQLYTRLPNASVDIRVLKQPMYQALWAVDSKSRMESGPPVKNTLSIESYTFSRRYRDSLRSIHGAPTLLRPYTLDRASAFACLAMFESGSYNIAPGLLDRVFAMSTGNSLYVAAALLCDPSQTPEDSEIRHIEGNIGRPGIALLGPPPDPLIRESKLSDWPQLGGTDFDGCLRNSFQDTSLHLSFTGAEEPVNVRFSGAQDIEVFFMETLISIFDRGKWIADLDICGSLGRPNALVRIPTCNQSHIDAGSMESQVTLESQVTCIDNWVSLIDATENHINLVRAHKNWQARLAAASLSVALGHSTSIFQEGVCWRCFKSLGVGYAVQWTSKGSKQRIAIA